MMFGARSDALGAGRTLIFFPSLTNGLSICTTFDVDRQLGHTTTRKSKSETLWMAKRGRAPKGEYAGKTEVMSFRITPSTKAALKRAAAAGNRSLSQEAEHRLRRGLDEDATISSFWGDAKTFAIMRLAAQVIQSLDEVSHAKVHWIHEQSRVHVIGTGSGNAGGFSSRRTESPARYGCHCLDATALVATGRILTIVPLSALDCLVNLPVLRLLPSNWPRLPGPWA